MTAFKLAIGDFIEFPVTLKVQDGATNKAFSFVLTARRLATEDVAAMADKDSPTGRRPLSDVLKGVITGWRGQVLVLGEDEKPAEFSAEALAAMLNIPGAAGVIFGDCLTAQTATAGKAGAQKN